MKDKDKVKLLELLSRLRYEYVTEDERERLWRDSIDIILNKTTAKK